MACMESTIPSGNARERSLEETSAEIASCRQAHEVFPPSDITPACSSSFSTSERASSTRTSATDARTLTHHFRNRLQNATALMKAHKTVSNAKKSVTPVHTPKPAAASHRDGAWSTSSHRIEDGTSGCMLLEEDTTVAWVDACLSNLTTKAAPSIDALRNINSTNHHLSSSSSNNSSRNSVHQGTMVERNATEMSDALHLQTATHSVEDALGESSSSHCSNSRSDPPVHALTPPLAGGDENASDAVIEDTFALLRRTHFSPWDNSASLDALSYGGEISEHVLFEAEEDPVVLSMLESSQSFSMLSQASSQYPSPSRYSQSMDELPTRTQERSTCWVAGTSQSTDGGASPFSPLTPTVQRRRADLRKAPIAHSQRSDEELSRLRRNTSFARVASGKVVFQTEEAIASSHARESGTAKRARSKNGGSNQAKQQPAQPSLFVDVLQKHAVQTKARRVNVYGDENSQSM